ncbi:hypothetical protein [Microbacterium sp. GCS4]|uniref:hypothetical protein n=1 Tax=Microbacterium sp. GCS4 TaxID=1692239 RepID=UPI000B075080|nr:hypothetical protein [Microbacterium sp. GCS4]
MHTSENIHRPAVRLVEEYFDEPIGVELYARILGSPIEHLVELAERIHAGMVAIVPELPGAGLRAPRSAHLFDELYLHDQRSGDAFTSSTLKTAILYSEKLVLPDPCLDWAEDLAGRGSILGVNASDAPREALSLKNAIRRLEPLLPLIDGGAVTLLPSPAHLRLDPFSMQTLDDFAHDRGAGSGRYRLAHREDPLLAWTLVNKFSPVDAWVYRETWGLDPLTEFFEAAHNVANEAAYDSSLRLVPDAVLADVFGAVNDQEITDALSMQRLSEGLPVIPFTNSAVVRDHLVQSSRVLFGEKPRQRTEERRGIEAAVHYQLPGVSNVTLDDVVRLRLNDDVHHEMRQGLTALAGAVAAGGHDSSYASFSAGFAELSSHHLRDRLERLEAAATRTKRKGTIAGWITSAFVSFSMNALLLAVGPDPVTEGLARAGGNAVANAAKSGVDQETSRRTRDIDTVRTLIGTLGE